MGSRNRTRKRIFKYTGLISCGPCRYALIGDEKVRNNKKATIARYTYYRCSGHKGKCGESYTREEELDRLFKAIVDEVCIP